MLLKHFSAQTYWISRSWSVLPEKISTLNLYGSESFCFTLNSSSNKKISRTKCIKKSFPEQRTQTMVNYSSWKNIGSALFSDALFFDIHVWELIKLRHFNFLKFYYSNPIIHRWNIQHVWPCRYTVVIL